MAELVPWEVSLEDGELSAYLHGKLTVDGSLSIPITSDIIFGDGDTKIYEYVDDTLHFKLANIDRWIFSGSVFYASAGRCGMRDILASSTVPNILPSADDSDTGLGSSALDNLSLITGGVEGIRVSETAGFITNIFYGISTDGSVQSFTSSGSIDPRLGMVSLNAAGAIALTLGNGSNGQRMVIATRQAGGAAVLTPTVLNGATTITFNNVGDSVQLYYYVGWNIIGSYGCVIA